MHHSVRGALRALVFAGALGIGLNTAALAQEQFPDAKLDSFITAAIKVEELITEWTPKIEGAADEAAAQEMREQANADLAQAIEDTSGITVTEYQEIAQAAQSDPELSARLKEIYESQASGG
jgi:hypothetical protein